MASSSLGAYFDILPDGSKSESKSKFIADPAPVARKPGSVKQISPIAPDSVELDNYSWGSKYTGPESENVSSAQTPNELEMSSPPSSKEEQAVSQVQSFSNPPMNRFRVLCACLIYFGNGMTDSAPGALIPYMEEDYNIGYAIVSLIFVTNAVGFIAAAFFIDWLHQKLGRAKALMFAESLVIAGYVMIGVHTPFPVVVVAYFFMGFGAAIGLALNNVFCANLANSTVLLGASHGSYGLGGTLAPIAATALASNGVLWCRFYLIILALRVLNVPMSGWSFRGYEAQAPPSMSGPRVDAEGTAQPSKLRMLKEALHNRVTILGALFIFAYQGAEVSISGWVISFLISYRDGDPAKVGYVTAGFWGGITIGRFVLTHLTSRIGEKPSVYGLIAGCTALQILVWFVPNVISNAVFVALLGLLLGPVYPCATTIFTRALPHSIQMISIGFISSAGSSGGAIAPLLTGILSQAVGTYVMHPVCVALFVVMVVCWVGLPKVEKREE